MNTSVLQFAVLLLLTAVAVQGDGTTISAPLTSGSPCVPSATGVTWNTTADTNVLQGVSTSDSTVDACKSTCIGNTSCNGFDWDNNTNASPRCWLSGPWSGVRRVGGASGITHFDKVTATGQNCVLDCTVKWSSPIANTNVAGGTSIPTALTLDDCKRECANRDACYGIDFDNNVGAVKCWLTGNGPKRTGLANLIDHYDITSRPGPECRQGCVLGVSGEGVVGLRSSDNKLIVTNDVDTAVVFQELPCLQTSYNGTGSCVSYTVPSKPGFYVRAVKGSWYLVSQDSYESKLSPSSFAEDASFKKEGTNSSFTLAATIYQQFKVFADFDNGLSLSDSLSTMLFCISAALSDQSTITGTCPDVWSSVSDAKASVYSGSSKLGANDITLNCRKEALYKPGSVGVSSLANSSDVVTDCLFVSTSDAGEFLVQSFGATHYDLWRPAPGICPRGCTYRWEQTNSGIRYSQIANYAATNVYECQRFCVRNHQTSCSGVTFSPTGNSTSCKIYSAVTIGGNYLNLWKFDPIFTGCGPCISSVGFLYNLTDVLAVPTQTVSGSGQCLTICLNRRGCIGYETRDGTCYVSTVNNATFAYTGNTPYRHTAVYRSPCGNGCVHKWDFYPGSKIDGSNVQNATEAKTETACRVACINVPTCTGCDFDRGSRSCVLGIANPSVNYQANANYNHFELHRDEYCDCD